MQPSNATAGQQLARYQLGQNPPGVPASNRHDAVTGEPEPLADPTRHRARPLPAQNGSHVAHGPLTFSPRRAGQAQVCAREPPRTQPQSQQRALAPCWRSPLELISDWDSSRRVTIARCATIAPSLRRDWGERSETVQMRLYTKSRLLAAIFGLPACMTATIRLNWNAPSKKSVVGSSHGRIRKRSCEKATSESGWE